MIPTYTYIIHNFSQSKEHFMNTRDHKNNGEERLLPLHPDDNLRPNARKYKILPKNEKMLKIDHYRQYSPISFVL